MTTELTAPALTAAAPVPAARQPDPPAVPATPTPAPAAPLLDAVVLLAVLVLLLTAGATGYLMYAHPGSRIPLGAALSVVAILAPLMYSTLRR